MPRYKVAGEKGQSYMLNGVVYEPGEQELTPEIAKKLWATPVGNADAPRADRVFEAQVAEQAQADRAETTKPTKK